MISSRQELRVLDELPAHGSVWRRLARGRLLDVMREVECLPQATAGALIVGERTAPTGMVFVEQNRVCWCGATGMGRRLRDLLRGHFSIPLSDDEWEAFFVRCRDQRQPLGESLIREGIASAEQVRSALKQHTVESLLYIDSVFSDENEALPLTWLERSSQGYNPTFTFGATEILAAIGQSQLATDAGEVMSDHLNHLSGPDCATIAFSNGIVDRPVFLGMRTDLSLRVEEMFDLAKWAAAALDASPGFSAAVAHACAQEACGAAAAWSYEGHNYAAVCTGEQALQRLISRLGNQSVAMVLATRLSVLDRVRKRTKLNAE